MCKSEEEARVRVQIGVLIAGSQDGVDHIIKCVRRNYIFTPNDRILNFDDLLPYWELTQCANCHKQNEFTTNEDEFSSQQQRGGSSNNSSRPSSRMDSPPSAGPSTSQENASNVRGNNLRPCCSYVKSGRSCYLVGDNHDSLNIKIVITPKSDYEF